MKWSYALLAFSLLAACGQSEPKSQSNAASDAPAAVANVSSVNAEGKALYRACAACHLPSGEGVSGSFPPLQGDVAQLSQSEAGRDYLVAVIKFGLQGEIKTSAGTYDGFMAAQAGNWSSDDMAILLNYLGSEFSPEVSVDPYSAEEIDATLARLGRLGAGDVAGLRPDLAK